MVTGLRAVVALVVVGAGALAQTVESSTFAESQRKATNEYNTQDDRILRVTQEILYDPEVSTTFHSPGIAFVDRTSGELYVVDSGDNRVRVLDPAGVELRSFGGSGEGPGEFAQLYRGAILENGNVAFFDSTRATISLFDPDGEFLSTFRTGFPTLRGLQGFLFLDDDRFALGISRAETRLHGNFVHVFDRSTLTSNGEARHVNSFAQTPDIAPRFYDSIVEGRISKDLDGGVLYSQSSPYSIRKYSADGTELWRLDDPEAFPGALTFYKLQPDGTIESNFYPRGYGLLPLGGDRYLHTVLLLREGWEPDGEIRYPWITRLEVLTVSDGTIVDRLTADLDVFMFFHDADAKGGVYGYLDDGETLAKLTFEVIPKTQ